MQFTDTDTQHEIVMPMAAAFLTRGAVGGRAGERRVAHSMYVYSPSLLSLHHLVLNVSAELADGGAKTLI
eukprot:SAG11_NODE_77_length_17985_cov_25.875657_13_plen_70_part_00